MLNTVDLSNLVVFGKEIVHIDTDPGDESDQTSVSSELEGILCPDQVDELRVDLPEPHEGHHVHVTDRQLVSTLGNGNTINCDGSSGEKVLADMSKKTLIKLTIRFPRLFV